MTKMTQVATAVVALALAQGAFAAVSADEAKQLGGDKLTVFGSEKAGNKDGTIPAYSGKSPKAPASYNKSEPGQRPNPYNDKPLFSITAQNADKYADKLDGMLEMFKKYPNFRMDIYPSRRDFSYTKKFLENTQKNATSCKAENDELKLEGCYGGMPFPIPRTGRQVMWNHLLQTGVYSYRSNIQSWVTPTNGLGVLQAKSQSMQQFPIYDQKLNGALPSSMVYWQGVQEDLAPARKVGNKLAYIDSLDMVGVGRRAYQYIPGQRRVKLAPNLAYDTPSPLSGGTSTMDDAKIFLGALDRFEFKLIGKKEKFIMYNNYDLSNHKVCPDERVVNNAFFPNPDCVRWELHRAWKVEATLKPEFRHIYAKRIFYWDEDVPSAGTAENYDASGKLYRITTSFMIPFFESEVSFGGNSDSSFSMDLQTGIWAAQGSQGIPNGGWWPVEDIESREFTPDALAGSGIR